MIYTIDGERRDMKKKIIIGIIAVLVLTAISAYGIKIMGQNQRQKEFREQMDLGSRYLVERDYESAIVAFSKAIEIDPRQPESYLKLAEAYAVLGDYENAIATLEKGYEYTSDSRIQEQKELYEKLAGSNSIIGEIEQLLQQEDREGVWERLRQDDYQEFFTYLKEILIHKNGDEYLLIYPCGHCYYGQMENGMRSGHGVWTSFEYHEGQMDYYDGLWVEDYPEGEGQYWTVCIPVPEDLFYYEGMWKQGMENGTIHYRYISNYGEGTYTEEYSYSTIDGIRQEVADRHPENKPTFDDAEWYCYYSDDEISNYSRRGQTWGIIHARKGIDDDMAKESLPIEEIMRMKREMEEGLRMN